MNSHFICLICRYSLEWSFFDILDICASPVSISRHFFFRQHVLICTFRTLIHFWHFLHSLFCARSHSILMNGNQITRKQRHANRFDWIKCAPKAYHGRNKSEPMIINDSVWVTFALFQIHKSDKVAGLLSNNFFSLLILSWNGNDIVDECVRWSAGARSHSKNIPNKWDKNCMD